MWTNKLTEALNIRYPIIQGPFGSKLSSVELTAAVSNLGGLGSFGAQPYSPEEIIETTRSIRGMTSQPFAINLWVSDRDERLDTFGNEEYDKLKAIFKPYFDELKVSLPEMPNTYGARFEDQVEAVLHAKPPVFSFIYGIPSNDVLAECRKLKIKTIGAATTVDEAIALEDAGVDAIVATGFEAGGHRVSFLRSAEESLMGTFALIPQVADRTSVPLIAAGGIADGRGIAAAMTLGADGVQIGTAFLACRESNASELHRAKLFSPEARYTTLTKAFTGRLARGISSKIASETRAEEQYFAPFPLQGMFLNELRLAAIRQRRADLFTFWSGQAASLLKHKTAGDLFAALINQTETIWQQGSGATAITSFRS